MLDSTDEVVNAPKKQRGQFRLRTLFILMAIVAMSCPYVGSYWRLSRRGMAESARAGNLDFWWYVSLNEVEHELINDSFDFLERHYSCRAIYLPLSSLDGSVFSNPPPWGGGTLGLSDPPPSTSPSGS